MMSFASIWRPLSASPRAAAKPMMKARHGRIISITSVVGATGNPGQANYAASKAGLVGMSKAMAQELASRGITVNCVAPGFIASAMTEALPDAQKDALNARIPMGRMGDGADIGAAVVYLASREAGYVTGQTLPCEWRDGDDLTGVNIVTPCFSGGDDIGLEADPRRDPDIAP